MASVLALQASRLTWRLRRCSVCQPVGIVRYVCVLWGDHCCFLQLYPGGNAAHLHTVPGLWGAHVSQAVSALFFSFLKTQTLIF